MMSKPHILVLADVRTWAWHRKATALKECLSDRFDIEILYSTEPGAAKIITARPRRYDLLHTFEVFQVGQIPGLVQVPHTTGITAHVWPTWEQREGKGTVRKWASKAVAFHANSKLLQREIQEHLGRDVWYVPNGVDETFFRRTEPRQARNLVVGWVGKDNPRKGPDLVAEACRRAGVELREVRRSSRNALPPEEMRAFYQGIHVLCVASDMDGTPNPALEAAACECAVVSNHIGNMPEFIEPGANGLFHDRSVDGIAAALRDLAGRPLEEVEEMGRAARRTVEREWTWKAMAENYAAMWAACVRR